MILVILATFIVFLSEVTSNVATAALMYPIVASFAVAIAVHPYGLMVGACLAATCAFMLPVGTPPNAIVFSSGYIRIGQMVKVGFWMNLISIVMIALFVYFFLPFLWNIDLQTPIK